MAGSGLVRADIPNNATIVGNDRRGTIQLDQNGCLGDLDCLRLCNRNHEARLLRLGLRIGRRIISPGIRCAVITFGPFNIQRHPACKAWINRLHVLQWPKNTIKVEGTGRQHAAGSLQAECRHKDA